MLSRPPPDAVKLRARLAEQRAPLSHLVEELLHGRGQPAQVGRALGRARALALDELFGTVFPRVLEAAGVGGEGIALAAVGGYGRGALALASDVDLRLLTAAGQPAQDVADALLYPLWDAGLPVGHQVVAADQLLHDALSDLPSATSLLEWRHLFGDRAASQALQRSAMRRVFSPSRLPHFVGELARQVRQRHRRYGASVYMLEPDVKNGRGALRDLDVARWIARARWSADSLPALVELGVILPRQLAAVERARELLWRIRNILHHRAGRRSDRLSFDEQERIAAALGYAGERHRADGAAGPERVEDVPQAAERLMSDYYRAARTLSRFRDAISARALPEPHHGKAVTEDLGGGVQLFNGRITVARHRLIAEQPAIAVRMLSAAVDRGVGLRDSARHALVAACGDGDWAQRLRGEPEAAARFVSLVSDCRDTGFKCDTVLQEMHDIGLLVAMVPELSPLVGRVHHDTYHVHTVDVHLVAAVDRLRQIVRGEVMEDEAEATAWEGSLAYQLASEVVGTKVLFFATLLHDLGKAIGRRDHSARGVELARAVLPRLPFDAEEIESVCRLIEHHLVMYRLATRRDLDDPSTIEELVRAAPNAEVLRQLYLLTVADLSTTSPTSMTSWKAHVLDELFLATDRWLAGRAAPVDDQAARIVAAKRVCEQAGGASGPAVAAGLERFVMAMPSRYRLTTTAEAMVAHAAVVARYLATSEPATVSVVPSRRSGGSEICVVATDRLGLLAFIAAALTASRLQVHAAHIYSCSLAAVLGAPAVGSGQIGAGNQTGAGNQIGAGNQTGAGNQIGAGNQTGAARMAVDFFWVQHASEAAAMDRAVARLGRHLCQLLGGERLPTDVVRLSAGRGWRAGAGPRVANKVSIDNRASPRYTVVEVFTRDRRGLLYRLADAMYRQRVSIALAKIATEGTRVVDVFYVSEHDEKKVTDELRLDALRRALVHLVDELDEVAR